MRPCCCCSRSPSARTPATCRCPCLQIYLHTCTPGACSLHAPRTTPPHNPPRPHIPPPHAHAAPSARTKGMPPPLCRAWQTSLHSNPPASACPYGAVLLHQASTHRRRSAAAPSHTAEQQARPAVAMEAHGGNMRSGAGAVDELLRPQPHAAAGAAATRLTCDPSGSSSNSSSGGGCSATPQTWWTERPLQPGSAATAGGEASSSSSSPSGGSGTTTAALHAPGRRHALLAAALLLLAPAGSATAAVAEAVDAAGISAAAAALGAGRVRSLRSETPCVLTIENRTTANSLAVYWCNYDGECCCLARSGGRLRGARVHGRERRERRGGGEGEGAGGAWPCLPDPPPVEDPQPPNLPPTPPLLCGPRRG